MKRSTPMKRTPFKRSVVDTKKAETNRALALEERALRAIKSAASEKARKSESNRDTALFHKAPAAMDMVAKPVDACPKTKAHRNARLRDMAKGMPCLLRVPGVCTNDSATVVCCHSNLSIHGKAGARKADDQYSVWGCAACHSWLDQGSAPRGKKARVFLDAHRDQVARWNAIAADNCAAPRERAAAQWALDLLSEANVERAHIQ